MLPETVSSRVYTKLLAVTRVASFAPLSALHTPVRSESYDSSQATHRQSEEASEKG